MKNRREWSSSLRHDLWVCPDGSVLISQTSQSSLPVLQPGAARAFSPLKESVPAAVTGAAYGGMSDAYKLIKVYSLDLLYVKSVPR